MNKILFALLFVSSFTFSQIKGTVKDKDGNPLPFVNIYIENTYIGTTSNELGKYELNTTEKNNVHLIFQYLGYKTQKHILNITSFPYEFDVALQEEDFQLKEVVVVNGENPANDIIRNAIKSKKKNAAKTDKFEADFYSRGIFRAKDIPKKFMGFEIGDLDGNLDSTRSGIIYQSETVSKIKFQKPDNLKEEINIHQGFLEGAIRVKNQSKDKKVTYKELIASMVGSAMKSSNRSLNPETIANRAKEYLKRLKFM